MKVSDLASKFLEESLKLLCLGDADAECKPDLPELEVKRIVLPFNTVNNRNIVQ